MTLHDCIYAAASVIVLHCQRLVGVLKELTVFALVYNLVRVVMLTVAQRQRVALERISPA